MDSVKVDMSLYETTKGKPILCRSALYSFEVVVILLCDLL